jgi:hypothetical protein
LARHFIGQPFQDAEIVAMAQHTDGWPGGGIPIVTLFESV